VLIGGLGMGYTLRQALDLLNSDAKIIVSELLGSVVDWNRDFLGELNNHPLKDRRVEMRVGDITQLVLRSNNIFDTILLDVDNGPDAMTNSSNSFLYSLEGMDACLRALRKNGCLAIWSVESSKSFEQLLMRCGFHVRRYRVPAYKGSKSRSRFVWVASENETNLPAGGGEPRRSAKRAFKADRSDKRRR